MSISATTSRAVNRRAALAQAAAAVVRPVERAQGRAFPRFQRNPMPMPEVRPMS